LQIKLKPILSALFCLLFSVWHSTVAQNSSNFDEQDVFSPPGEGSFSLYGECLPKTYLPYYQTKIAPLHTITDTSRSETCKITRYVAELGSSNAKFFSAEGNPCTNTFNFSSTKDMGKYPLNLSHFTENGILTEEGIQLIISTIQKVQAQVDQDQLSQWSIIATAVIREAANSKEIQDRVFKAFGIPVTVLSHTEEADFGVGTAYALIAATGREAPENAFFVDQGGSSTQVNYVRVESNTRGGRFLAKMGTHQVVRAIKSVCMSYGLDENQIFPLPKTVEGQVDFLGSLYSHIADLFKLSADAMTNFQGNADSAYGVARAHQFCVLPLANPSGDHFTTSQVSEALERLSVLNASEIMRLYSSVQNPLEDFATMLLTYTIMNHFDWKIINVLPITGSSLTSALTLLPNWTSPGPYSQPYWSGNSTRNSASTATPNITTIVNVFKSQDSLPPYNLRLSCPL
jgi:hypothetical protein